MCARMNAYFALTPWQSTRRLFLECRAHFSRVSPRRRGTCGRPAGLLRLLHPAVQRVLGDSDARGHVHHREAALEHLLHRLGPEFIRVSLAAHEHLCCSHELWPAGVYKRLGGPDFNREIVHIEVDTSITSQRLVRIFEQIRQERPLPQVLRTDNGPEFLGAAFTAWAKANGMAIQYIQPGKPNQNAYIERFNRTYREDVLDRYLFARLDDVREATWRFLIDYNEHREHGALHGMTPHRIPQSTRRTFYF